MKARQSGSALHIGIIIALVALILAALGFLLWQNLSKNNSAPGVITNFAECKASPGSILQESYPERCVAANGQSFVNPDQQAVAPEETDEYCAPKEKLCFEYPNGWTVQDLGTNTNLAGEFGDALLIKNDTGIAPIAFYSGIGGLGGYCPDEARRTVTILQGTAIPQLTGFGDEYSLDTLHIARVIDADQGGYIAALYVTDSEEYTKAGNIQACGTGFSQFINGRNARFDAESSNAGAFSIGYTGQDSTIRYESIDAAKAAFNTAPYVEAFNILLSLHYAQ